MTHQAFEAYLASQSASVNDPWHYVAVVAAWFRSAASSLIDTPEERAAIVKAFTTGYDAITLRFAPRNPALAALFVAMRGWAIQALDTILVAMAPAPPPTPAPAVIPVNPPGGTP